MAISDYSTTAASNTSISGISLAENVMVPSDVNNAIRQMMADIKAGVPYLSGTTYLIESTDAGATAGPDFATYRNSASPAASDLIGRYLFQGEDSAGNTETYAAIAGRISDPTSTSEDAALLVQAALAGTLTTYIYVGANAAGTATANAVGLPLGQLSFPATQNASSDVNTLDDYEEGTFTPTLAFGGASTGITYGGQTGVYTKIGNTVFATVTVTLTNKGSATGTPVIAGLPFTAGSTGAVAATSCINLTGLLVGGTTGVLGGGGTTVTLRQNQTTGTTGMTEANFTNTSSINLTVAYQI